MLQRTQRVVSGQPHQRPPGVSDSMCQQRRLLSEVRCLCEERRVFRYRVFLERHPRSCYGDAGRHEEQSTIKKNPFLCQNMLHSCIRRTLVLLITAKVHLTSTGTQTANSNIATHSVCFWVKVNAKINVTIKLK